MLVLKHVPSANRWPLSSDEMSRVVVLLHEDDLAFEKFSYAIKSIIEEWRRMGLAVEIVRGTDRFVPGDVVVPHIDLTVTPGAYREFVKQYPIVINRGVLDISKSVISAQRVARGDAYTGPVIVKSDLNHGGLPEKRIADLRRRRSLPRRLARRIMATSRPRENGPIAWQSIQYLESHRYSVFPSIEALPGGVFENRNLIVERFLPELMDGYYCLRSWFFLGDKGMNTLLKSKEKVVKIANSSQIEGSSSPPELHTMREQLGFDYGKFDYVFHDGKVVLFDVNPTPTIEQSPLGHKVTRLLANGICSKLK